jgi:hypothetical protein
VNLLERSVAGLGQEQDDENDEDHVGSEPDVSVLCAPAQLGRVDEIRGGEGPEPVAEEVGRCCQAEGERAELVVWEFSAH